MIILVLYLLIVLSFVVFQKKDFQNPIFRSGKNVVWWVSGISLYMHYLSVDTGQLIAGVIGTRGMSGMWILWASWIGAFVIPLVFAPLWKRLDFMTDNQFLLFRFPGKSGRIIHQFRAIYVGGFVVSLALCFHVIGFSRILSIYFDVSQGYSLLITGIILSVYALKNVLSLKLKMDVFHAFLFFLSLLIVLISLWQQHPNLENCATFFKGHHEKRQLFPTTTETWFTLFVYLGIQWWSCNLFDGGGPEMARFTAVKNEKKALLAGLLPQFIGIIAGFLMVAHVIWVLGLNTENHSPELFYVESVFGAVSSSLKPLILLGFFGMFITTAESLLNWGASFLVVDVIKGRYLPKIEENKERKISYLVMLILSVLSVVFASQVESLQTFIQLTFSISAGVAPVYILRWVWFRINAWSQLSAMLGSGIFTLIYPSLHPHLLLHAYPLAESRVLVVTVLTTLLWLTVTFLTPNQSAEVRLKMLPILGSRKVFLNRFLLAILFGVGALGFISVVWFSVLG